MTDENYKFLNIKNWSNISSCSRNSSLPLIRGNICGGEDIYYIGFMAGNMCCCLWVEDDNMATTGESLALIKILSDDETEIARKFVTQKHSDIIKERRKNIKEIKRNKLDFAKYG